MRISDWSSDVCSSDLLLGQVIGWIRQTTGGWCRAFGWGREGTSCRQAMHSIQARLGGESLLHSVAMQDVGGERVEQHGGRDLLDAPDRELPEFAVSPVAVDAFADRQCFVDRLAGLAGHA